MRRLACLLAVVFPGVLIAAALGSAANGQVERPAPDPVAQLAADLARGEQILTHGTDGQGYLPSLLERLEIPAESQVVVFSKSSLQSNLIDPKRPRAIYFNDTVAVGAIPGAPLLELTAIGKDGRLRFYTMETGQQGPPRVEESSSCMSCHGGEVPGAATMIVLNVTPFRNGDFVSAAQDRLADFTTARTPVTDRWGGWYVTGHDSNVRHRGNAFAEGREKPHIAAATGQNLTDLSGFFDTRRYLRASSDIVALMTLEHQVGFATLATKVNDQVARGEESRVIEATVGEIADYMVGADQAVLEGPIRGGSGFAQSFARRAPFDPAGRSLREFDLRTRLFRYPLSYMIYSPAFDAIAPEAKTALYRRLVAILTGADRSPRYAGLLAQERAAALEIVASTKPGLPGFWPGALQASSSVSQ